MYTFDKLAKSNAIIHSKPQLLNRSPLLPAVVLHFVLTFAIGFDGRHQIRMNFYLLSNEL